MTIREKIVAEIAEISEYLSKLPTDVYYRRGGKAERFITLINSVFGAVSDERQNLRDYFPSSKEWHAATVATFEATFPEGNDPHIVGLGVDQVRVNGDNVEVTRVYETWKSLPARKEIMTKWVQTDENTRVRETVLDGFGKPKTKNMKAETVSEKTPVVFVFPIVFFEDLLTEIEQDSLITAPDESYIPEPLGINLKKAFGGLGGFGGSFIYDGWGPPVMHPMHPMNRVHYRQDTPFRLFLKPEEGTGRLEVIVEPYPEEEIKASRTLISNRESWRKGDISRTKVVSALCERVKAKYVETIKKSEK